MKQIIYFGHPINSYDSELEKVLIAKIVRTFPNCVIENPNQEKHQAGYNRWKEGKYENHRFSSARPRTGPNTPASRASGQSNGMNYYFSEVLPFCDTGIYLPFRDGAWGAGVFGEANFFASKNDTPWAWTINADALIRLVHLENVPVLSISETRARIYGPNGILLPY
jgi:hypothetical protein